jgi:histidyl-tRNA synthetase
MTTNPPAQSFSRPPGVYDLLPNEQAQMAALIKKLEAHIALFGYQTIETPLVEYADLFLTKSGDEALARLFTFEMYGRLLCLRSEFTPSVARLYIEHFQHEPKPIRWQLSGPVFRYESPGRNHSRQFTTFGTELIGAAGSVADTEMIGMAANTLRHIGLSQWGVAIGHVGLLGLLLDRFDLDRQMKRRLLGQVENLRRPDRGRPYVEAEIEKLYSGQADSDLNSLAQAPSNLEQAMQLVLASANLGPLGVGRSSEDIARRLQTKRQRAQQKAQTAAALDLLTAVAQIDHPVAEALPLLAAHLGTDADSIALFDQFRQTLNLITAYGLRPEQIRLQMGLARGLNYYTGIVFEFHSSNGVQLCGGGRYDDFLRVLGAAQDTPAVGFVFGVDRLLAELAPAPVAPASPLLIAPLNQDDVAVAVLIANLLRDSYFPVELHPMAMRSLGAVLASADKRRCSQAMAVDGQKVTYRNLISGVQVTGDYVQIVAQFTGERHEPRP